MRHDLKKCERCLTWYSTVCRICESKAVRRRARSSTRFATRSRPKAKSKFPVVKIDELNLLLELMHRYGTRWSEAGLPLAQVWGHHLLEDWKSLSLLADKIAEKLDDR